MSEKFKPKNNEAMGILPVKKDNEKTPPLFGLKNIFKRDKSSESIELALLKHTGEISEETKHESQKPKTDSAIELEKEVLAEDEEFIPIGTIHQAKEDEDIPAFDLRISTPPDALEAKKEITKTDAPMIPEPKIGPAPNEETITQAVLEEIKRINERETKGFKSAGERIRVILPDMPNDPEKVKRLTELGLKMIEMVDKRNIKIKNK